MITIVIVLIVIVAVVFGISYFVLRSRLDRQNAVEDYMKSHGFDRRPVNDGKDGWIWIKKNNPDIKIAEDDLLKMTLNQVKEKYI